QKPHPPVLFATLGPSPLVIRHADGWLPLSAKDPAELPERIAGLRARAAEAGRDPSALEITVFSLERTPPERVAEYAAMGADRVVLRARLRTLNDLSTQLDAYQDLIRG
ncbi:MAG TPA: LLM class flavin-dependent oxidoreductase, partial [Acidimicrobiia bacterium]|nr:LLM class flavin-dependent oxidoreductase [Acidimicrobiia bacterium]